MQTSAENYLETILVLSRDGRNVRSVDISTELGYSKPSVSIAMKKLRQDGYIVIDINGYITLTKSGCAIAESMFERHTILSDWLISIGVDEKTALDDACSIEHVISEESFLAIKGFLISN